MSRVSQELATIITSQSSLINKNGFPTLTVPPCGDRSEVSKNPVVQILKEAEGFGVHSVKDGTVTVGITSAASPHTPEMIKNPSQNQEKSEIPAHFIVWAADTSNDNPIAILDIAKMSDEERQRYWQLIAGGIEHAVHILKTSLSKEKNSIEIYGLGGHISPEERRANGLGRGAQSHPLFHINVVAHQYDQYKKEAKPEKISPRDFLKQAGPMDTLFMNNFKYDIVAIINNLLKQTNTPFQTQAEEATSIGKNLVRFYEGISIENPDGLPLEQSFETIGKIVGLFASLYDSLRHYFDIYWLSSDQKQTRKEAVIQLGLLLDKIDYPQKNDFIKRLVEFAFSFYPTYQQVNHWLNQNQIPLDENVKKRLSRLEKIYKYIQDMPPARRKSVLTFLKGAYGFDDFQAEAYLQFLIDASSPGENWKSIEYVWSGKLSFSYMFEKYHIDENGQIIVDKTTLAPRFFTNKGAFEDIGGLRIVRNTGV
jgi:hypothetical protein